MLSEKQQRFVSEYLVDLNATEAYKRAGYADTPAAHHNAARLMAKDTIQDAISAARSRQRERTELTADEVIRGLRAETGRFGKGSLHSARVSAWGLLGKHIGMFADQLQHTFPEGVPIGPADADAGVKSAAEHRRQRMGEPSTNGTPHADGTTNTSNGHRH